MDSAQKPGLISLLRPLDAKGKNEVDKAAESYLQYFDENDPDKVRDKRKENSIEMTSHYYDVVTDFYEYGWGESFHFSTLRKGESREHAFAKHEYKLALKLGLTPKDKVLDIGCGVGGPARHIAAFSEATIIGLNYNRYQIKRAENLTKKAGLENHLTFCHGDFNKMPFSEGTFDKTYAIEATCHAPDVSKVYGEAYRTLKPGGMFACWEWIVTDKYDSNNKMHKQIIEGILEGDGLPELRTASQVKAALKKVGFEILEAEDMAPHSEVPWYSVLEPKWTLSDLKITPVGRWLTHIMLFGLETLHLAPKGSCKVVKMLNKGADSLVKGGKEDIFSPLYFFLVRKPKI